MSSGAKIGIGVGAGIVVVSCVVLGVVLYKRQQARKF